MKAEVSLAMKFASPSQTTIFYEVLRNSKAIVVPIFVIKIVALELVLLTISKLIFVMFLWMRLDIKVMFKGNQKHLFVHSLT